MALGFRPPETIVVTKAKIRETFSGLARRIGVPPDLPKANAADGFDVVVLGGLGGVQDGNLSSFLIHPHGDDRAVTCDAGTW